jgi:CRISPR-associated endonuclease/helicase Cas3
VENLTRIYQTLSGKDISPNPFQIAMGDTLLNDIPCARLVMAPTGSGKTEAVLYPAVAHMAGETDTAQRTRLIMVYPARSLLEDQEGRIEKTLINAGTLNGGKSWSYVVDYGGRRERVIPGQEKQREGHHHYFGDVILTTIDSFIYRMFGFGLPSKSFIFPHRIFGDAKRTIVCFDEAHSYDGVAFTNFLRIIETLYANDASVICMTATMPDEVGEMLPFGRDKIIDAVSPKTSLTEELDAWRNALPDYRSPERTLRPVADVAVELPEIERDDLRKIREQRRVNRVGQIVDDVRKNPCDRTIVAVETVKSAVEVWESLESGRNDVFLYHGRLAPEHRRKVYADLAMRDAANDPYLLITTSAIEVGCDLSAQRLVTEVCFPEQLIQRAGRCNRRGEVTDAEIAVVGDLPSGMFRPELSGESLETFERALTPGPFCPQAFREAIEVDIHVDYRAQMLFDQLYSYVYKFNREYEKLHEKGIIVTRSWEPTVSLVAVDQKTLDDPAASVPSDQTITVPISWLWGNGELVEAHAAGDDGIRVVQRSWTDGESGRERRTLKSEELIGGNLSAYKANIVVKVLHGSKYYPDDKHGYANLPKILTGGKSHNDPYTMQFFYEAPGQSGKPKKARLWYNADTLLGDEIAAGALTP